MTGTTYYQAIEKKGLFKEISLSGEGKLRLFFFGGYIKPMTFIQKHNIEGVAVKPQLRSFMDFLVEFIGDNESNKPNKVFQSEPCPLSFMRYMFRGYKIRVSREIAINFHDMIFPTADLL